MAKGLDLAPGLPEFVAWISSGEDSSAVAGETTVLDLFEARVAESPNAIALECYSMGGGLDSGESWSRRRVQEVSRRIAKLLAPSASPSPSAASTDGCCVGLALDEGAPMVLFELAIGYFGHALHFFPVDLRAPARRVVQLLEDTKAVMLILPDTSDALPQDLVVGAEELGCELVSAKALLEGALKSVEAGLPSESSAARPKPEDLCYIQFTSGSTGQPKGVLCEHRQAAWYARAKAACEGIDEKSRMLLTAAFTFDPCQGDTFCALASGATLLLVPRVSLLHDLKSIVASTRATHLCATPALWRLVEGPASTRSPTSTSTPSTVELGRNLALRCLSLGGEKMPPGMVQEWASQLTLRNIYGVTEATVYQTAMVMGETTSPQLAGRPLAGLAVSVMPWPAEADDADSTTEEDEGLGEICIAGPGVARGYLNSPALTLDRFRPLPGDTKCFYKTGDCGRWTTLGGGPPILQIVGRRDMQVKLNGERIELGEVEHHLHSSPLVKACAVLPWLEAGTLVAFVVLAGNEVLDGLVEVALSSHCELTLPRAMRPRRFIDLEALPVSSNGKVDRKALVLPKVSEVPLSSGANGEALTPMEAAVALAWITELGLAGSAQLAKDSDFYALGGGSVQAVRVTRALRNVLHGGGGGGQRWAEGKSDWRDPAGDAALFLPPERAGDAECHFGLCDGGPFAPCGLLERPLLKDYTAWLESMGVRLEQDNDQDQRQTRDLPSAATAAATATSATSSSAAAATAAARSPQPQLSPAAAPSTSSSSSMMKRPEARLVKALEASIRTNRVLLARSLLVAGACPNGGLAPRDLGTRPLHWAAGQGNVEVAGALLEARAHLAAATQQGALPAHVAAAGGHASVLELLLQAGTPPCTRDKARQSLIHYAARRGCVDVLRLAVQAGAEVDARDSQMRTALHWAALSGDLDVAKVLLLEARAALEPPKVSASVHRRATRLTQETPLEIALRKHPDATDLHTLLTTGSLLSTG